MSVFEQGFTDLLEHEEWPQNHGKRGRGTGNSGAAIGRGKPLPGELLQKMFKPRFPVENGRLSLNGNVEEGRSRDLSMSGALGKNL